MKKKRKENYHEKVIESSLQHNKMNTINVLYQDKTGPRHASKAVMSSTK
jgi:hypothetical protein